LTLWLTGVALLPKRDATPCGVWVYLVGGGCARWLSSHAAFDSVSLMG
jgi:hypothetical protein